MLYPYSNSDDLFAFFLWLFAGGVDSFGPAGRCRDIFEKYPDLEQYCTQQAKGMSKGGEKVGQREGSDGCLLVGRGRCTYRAETVQRVVGRIDGVKRVEEELFSLSSAACCHLGRKPNVPERAFLLIVYI